MSMVRVNLELVIQADGSLEWDELVFSVIVSSIISMGMSTLLWTIAHDSALYSNNASDSFSLLEPLEAQDFSPSLGGFFNSPIPLSASRRKILKYGVSRKN
jgi:hypothetical protein